MTDEQQPLESFDEPDLVTVEDEDGVQHQFEIIDAIETDEGRYVALLPYEEDDGGDSDEAGELVILAVEGEEGAEMLVPIEDDELFDDIASVFEERLSVLYEIDVLDGDDA